MAGSRQVIIHSEKEKVVPLKNEDEIKAFYQKNSKSYNSIFSIDLIAKGGEAAVYRVEHANLEELVAKCCLFDEGQS